MCYCAGCGTKIVDKSHAQKLSGKMYCISCYQALIDKKEQTEDKRKGLEKYICELFSLSECPVSVQYTLDQLIDKEHFKLTGIKKTLYYYYTIKGNYCDNVDYIGNVVKRYYEDAKKYDAEMKETVAFNKQVNYNVPVTNIVVPSHQKEKKKELSFRIEDL